MDVTPSIINIARAFLPVMPATREWSDLVDTLMSLATALLDARAIMKIAARKNREIYFTVTGINHYQFADILLAKRRNYVSYYPHS